MNSSRCLSLGKLCLLWKRLWYWIEMSTLLLLWKHAEIKSRSARNTAKIMEDTVFTNTFHGLSCHRIIIWHCVMCRGGKALCGCAGPVGSTQHDMLIPSCPEVMQWKHTPHKPILGMQKMNSKGPVKQEQLLFHVLFSSKVPSHTHHHWSQCGVSLQTRLVFFLTLWVLICHPTNVSYREQNHTLQLHNSISQLPDALCIELIPLHFPFQKMDLSETYVFWHILKTQHEQ